MNNILAGIVLYNPQIERLILELKSIEKQVQKICMFDNGSNNYSEIEKVIESISFRDKIVLLRSADNKGIGYALNKIFEYALDNKYVWVLTLDHDTICPPNMMMEYCRYTSMEKLGILCPRVIDKEIVNNSWDSEGDTVMEKVKVCIQSGALVNVKVWEIVQRFDEWMFIDFVDFDFCKKVDINHFTIFRCNRVVIDHELGKRCRTSYARIAEYLYSFTKVKSFVYLTYKNIFSKERIYYCTRNNITYIKKYSKFLDTKMEYRKLVSRIITRIIRGQNRWMIIRETWKGIKSALHCKIEPYYIQSEESMKE